MHVSRKDFGRGATCGVAGHGTWRGHTRKSSTRRCVEYEEELEVELRY